ncbi:hypothetical protein ACTFIZ_002537 [Dictyostelium cf. discoideum]
MKFLNLFLIVLSLAFLCFGSMANARYIGCQTCETLVQEAIDTVPKYGVSKQEISDKIYSLCNSIPTLSSRCKLIVTIYGETLVDAILDGENANQTCKFLNECN